LSGLTAAQQQPDVVGVGLLNGQVNTHDMKQKKPRGSHRAVDYSYLIVPDQNVIVTRPQK
jgi:hypothetical protein